MASISFNVTERKTYGTGSARELRRNGGIPAVIYGPGRENKHLVISSHELLKVKDGLKDKDIILINGSESINAIVKTVQYHPVKDSIIHIDFLYR